MNATARILIGNVQALVATEPTPCSPPPKLGERRRIWELEPGRHCSVLGTCLTLDDLHVIARRARCQVPAGISAYQLHSWFVDMAATANALSKLVDKELEKRHAKAAQIVRRAKTEQEIEAKYKEVSASGRIAGAYWGALSHPRCSNELAWSLFGDIHMLSHLVGSSRRADLARVHELEGQCAALDAQLAQVKHEHRSSLKDHKLVEDELASRRREGGLAARRLATAERRIAELESATLAGELQSRVDDLERRLARADARAAAAEASLVQCRAEAAKLREADARAAALVRELTAENDALEMELSAGLGCPFASEESGEVLVGGLAGKRILCVGGRTNLIQHYRALVERHGGELLHHDGGIEESLDAVTRAISTVDAVVCPVDYVSHAATIKVKRACRHLAKELVVLRSSGLSSFARCIRTIAGTSAPRAEGLG